MSYLVSDAQRLSQRKHDRRPWHRLLGLLVIGFGACRSQDRPIERITTIDSAGVRIVRIPASPTRASANSVSDELEPTLVVDVTSTGDIQYASDVAGSNEGGFAVLDRIDSRIVLFDSSGHVTGSLGRRGRGPGEFNSPMALEAVSNGFAVLEPADNRTLLFVPTDPSAKPARALNLAGEFLSMRSRGPSVYFSSNVAESFADPSRRLRIVDDSIIYVELQGNPLSANYTSLAHLGRINADFGQIDTVASFQTVKATVLAGGRVDDAVHERRGLWAVGRNWIATSSSDQSSIAIQREGARLVIQWPADSVAISKDDRTRTAQWLGEYTAMFDRGAGQTFQQMSSSERQNAYEMFAQSLTFATRRPEMAGMIGADRCLLIAGWSATDARDGTSRSWTAITADSGTVVGKFRLAFPDSRVRDARGGRLFTTFLDTLGRSAVAIYPLPAVCAQTP